MACDMDDRLIALDFFCGMGGLSAAAAPRLEVAGAFDQSPHAKAAYLENLVHPFHSLNLHGLTCERIRRFKASVWLASPPCQPYSRKGLGRDLDDPRAETVRWLARRVEECPPRGLLVENVPEFAESRARELLVSSLRAQGFGITEVLVCPSELGIPNRRRRYYLLAAQRAPRVPEWSNLAVTRELADYLVPDPEEETWLDREELSDRWEALDRVQVGVPGQVSACFGSGYSRAALHSGSYLVMEDGRVRLFSPREILRLLHFPEGFRFPRDMELSTCYRLAGGSVNVLVVSQLLDALLDAV